MEAPTVELLVQAGAVGLALALIALLYFQGKTNRADRSDFNKIVGNHMSKTDSIIEKNAIAMTTLAGAIQASVKVSDRTATIMERVERRLDRG